MSDKIYLCIDCKHAEHGMPMKVKCKAQSNLIFPFQTSCHLYEASNE